MTESDYYIVFYWGDSIPYDCTYWTTLELAIKEAELLAEKVAPFHENLLCDDLRWISKDLSTWIRIEKYDFYQHGLDRGAEFDKHGLSVQPKIIQRPIETKEVQLATLLNQLEDVIFLSAVDIRTKVKLFEKVKEVLKTPQFQEKPPFGYIH